MRQHSVAGKLSHLERVKITSTDSEVSDDPRCGAIRHPEETCSLSDTEFRLLEVRCGPIEHAYHELFRLGSMSYAKTASNLFCTFNLDWLIRLCMLLVHELINVNLQLINVS